MGKRPTVSKGSRNANTPAPLRAIKNPRPESSEEDRGEGSSQSGSDVQEGDHDLGDPDALSGVAQWVHEDELDDGSEEEGIADTRREQGRLESLRTDLSALPFGTLRKAQKELARTRVDDDSEDDHSDDGSVAPSEEESMHPGGRDKGKEKEVVTKKPKKEIVTRKNKHAPTEVTSKRPVSRHRMVVEVHNMDVRDPRFLPLAGEFDPKQFRRQYGFIADLHQSELKTLRDNLKRARKLFVSSPRDTRAEREHEVERLELAVKRAESSVNRDKREKIEHEALSRASKEEREKREKGKGQFWLKDSEKKKLLLKARYEAVAAEGGKGAVKKAIEKKQKKLSQKETKARPFSRQAGGNSTRVGDGQSSKRTRDEGYLQRKRQKVA